MFGKAIKTLRKKHGLTQTELAEKLNISVTSVCSMELNKTIPKQSTLDMIYSTFKINSNILLLMSIDLDDVKRNISNKNIGTFNILYDSISSMIYGDIVENKSDIYVEFNYAKMHVSLDGNSHISEHIINETSVISFEDMEHIRSQYLIILYLYYGQNRTRILVTSDEHIEYLGIQTMKLKSDIMEAIDIFMDVDDSLKERFNELIADKINRNFTLKIQ